MEVILIFFKPASCFGAVGLALIPIAIGLLYSIGADVPAAAIYEHADDVLIPILLIAALMIFIMKHRSSLPCKLTYLAMCAVMTAMVKIICNMNTIPMPAFMEGKPWLFFPLSYAPMLVYSIVNAAIYWIGDREEDHEHSMLCVQMYNIAFIISFGVVLFAEAGVNSSAFFAIIMSVLWCLLGGLVCSILTLVASLPLWLSGRK